MAAAPVPRSLTQTAAYNRNRSLGMALSTIVLASLALGVQGQIALEPGFYTFETLAGKLSSAERPVTAARSLKGRAIYLRTEPLTRSALLEVLRAASGVTLVNSGEDGRTDRLVPEDAVLRRERDDRAALIDHLRRRVVEIRDEAENLRRDGEESTAVIARADAILRGTVVPAEGDSARARAVDALAEADVLLWAALMLGDLPAPESRVAAVHAFSLLPAFALPATPASDGALRGAAAIAMGRTGGVDGASLATLESYAWLHSWWSFEREPGRLWLRSQSQWILRDGDLKMASSSAAALVPSSGQSGAGLGHVSALYAGVPGSRRCGPLLSPVSRARYATLGASTEGILATDEGRALATALGRGKAGTLPGTFSGRIAAWARTAKTAVAFELDPLGDAPDRYGETSALPGFSEWRLSRVAGVTVASNLLDFVDRAIPVDAAALAPLVARREEGPRPLDEAEVRAYYRAAGPTPGLPGQLPRDAYGLPIGALRSGGAAFLAYEAVRRRPEIVRRLKEGKVRIEVPLATLDDGTIQTILAALETEEFSTLRFHDSGLEALRSASLVLTVGAPEAGDLLGVELRHGRETSRRFGFIFGFGSRLAFAPTPRG